MSAPWPKTITNELFERLEAYFASGAQPTPFERAALAREAGKLARVAPAKAALVRASIAALVWDTDAMRAENVTAYSLDPSIETLENASTSSRIANDFEDARRLSRQALQRAPADEHLRGRL